MKVGYQGEEHSYSYRASRQLFRQAEWVGHQTFIDAFAALQAGDVERLVLPVENSTTGSVLPVLDRLASERIAILAEHKVEVRHTLLGLPGASLDGLKRVISHPEALSQAAKILHELGVRAVPTQDTAGAVREVAENGDPTVAALAPEESGLSHGLQVLQRDVMDRDHNTTRFVVLAAGEPDIGPSDDKTSIVFVTSHTPGALALALTELGLRGANLTRIESRPSEAAWQYRFFVDLVHEPGIEALKRIIEPQPSTLKDLKVLGSYKSTS